MWRYKAGWWKVPLNGAASCFFFRVIAGWMAQTDSVEWPPYVRLTSLISFREDWRRRGPWNQNVPTFSGCFTSALEKCLKSIYHSCNQGNAFLFSSLLFFSLNCFKASVYFIVISQKSRLIALHKAVKCTLKEGCMEACVLDSNMTCH